jgi:hypothetical protein
MSDRQPQQTLGDYVTVGLSPALIMALVGSLIFFLLEVLYAGQYSGRLQWTLFFFVFGIVLIARISIEMGGGKALMYGLAMAASVYFTLLAYIEYPPGSALAAFGWLINGGLIALAWWCAHRLTWDCTFIDDDVDASGKGVLEAAGLEDAAPEPSAAADKSASKRKKVPTEASFALLAWWDRYCRYTEELRRKPHTPGVWVVYFSLAALPIFGLGQALIPVEEADRRRYVFWLMAVYVASGLGLLLTTSYLGLRRYLRQRKLQMPVAMTTVWMGLGATLIVVFLLVGALLPRPYGEYQVINIRPIGTREREASRYAMKRDAAAKGEGQASSDTGQKDDKAQSGSGTRSGNQGKGQSSTKSSGGQSGRGSSGSGSQGGSGQGKGQSQGKDSSSKSDPERKDGERNDRSDEQKDGDKRDSQSSERRKDDGDRQSGSASSGSKSSDDRSNQGRSGSSSSPSQSPILSTLSKLGWIGTLLKWILFGVLAVAALFFVLRGGLRFLANFTGWARWLLGLLNALFGRRPAAPVAAAEEADPEAHIERPRPFAWFQNPFIDGSADRRSPNQLVRYSFEALQSWAWERQLGRHAQETPLEFVERFVGEVPALEAEARGLVGLYARVAYARANLNPASLERLRQFWEKLEVVQERPLSA